MNRVLDLFAGCGGMAEGFRRAGFAAAGHVEIDTRCQAVLRRHFTGEWIGSDIHDTDGAKVEPANVIAFGSPCQDLSVAGARAGLAGSESGLFFEAIRVIREMREATDGRYPDFAVWENVCGAFSSHGGRDFASILAALRECGAVDIGWRVLDAQYAGVAQRRRRVFVVADFGGERAAEILSLTESVCGNPPPRREAGARVAGAVKTRFGKRGADDNAGQAEHLVTGCLLANYATKWGLDNQHVDAGCPMFVLNCNTDTTQQIVRGAFGVRRLTPRECDRLQAFPDDWTAWGLDESGNRVEMSDAARYTMLGNAVCVNVAEVIARAIVMEISKDSRATVAPMA